MNTTNTNFVLAPSAALASTVDAHVTVEAEYGSVVAEGSLYTAAHHQPGMEDLPAPCNDKQIPVLTEGTVLVSHLDLDSIGGCLRTVAGTTDTLFTDEYQSFWNLAHFVDINGAHKLGESGASDEDLLRLHAFWAWSKANVSRDHSREEVTDVTETIHTCKDAILSVLKNDQAMLKAGQEMIDQTQALNEATFERVLGNVILRVTNEEKGFCNHLYTAPTGEGFAAVAAYNKEAGSITISLAESVDGVSCRDVMQGLFGMEAGGHNGIAGSPREQFMTVEQFENTATTLSENI